MPEVIETDVELFLGESITVNGITTTVDYIDAPTLDVRYTFSCLGTPLEGELVIPGPGRNRYIIFPDENIYVYILQKEVTISRVIFDITVRQDT